MGDNEINFNGYSTESELQQPPSNEYLRVILAIIKSGVVENDLEYFYSDTFEYHYSLIPELYLRYFLGMHKDYIDVDTVRELIVRRMRHD